MNRTLGNWTVPALGAGTWAIGGPWTFDGIPAGWGEVDDRVSTAALRAAFDGGVRLFDTADVYGCGHSERVLGAALSDVREEIVLATKVGLLFDEESRSGKGSDLSAAYIRRACQDSLRRLGTDRIDVYQLHPGDATVEQASEVVEVFAELREAGKILAYGVSTDSAEIIEIFAASGHAVSVQEQVNVFGVNSEAIARCEKFGLAVLAKSPLAMGLLSGKYVAPTDLADTDVRRVTPHWDYFRPEEMPRWLDRLASVRDILTSGGRTLVQGALGYVWAASPATIALPGIRTPEQARELAGALEFGALSDDEFADVSRLMDLGK